MWYTEVLLRSAQRYEKTLPVSEQLSEEQLHLLQQKFLNNENILIRGYFYIQNRQQPINSLFAENEKLPLNFIYSWIDIFTFLAAPANLYKNSSTPFTSAERLKALARAYICSYCLSLEIHLGITPNDAWKYIFDHEERNIDRLNQSISFYNRRFSFRQVTPKVIRKIHLMLTEAEVSEAKAQDEKTPFAKSKYWYINAAIKKIQEKYLLDNEQLTELNNLFLKVRRVFIAEENDSTSQTNARNVRIDLALHSFANKYALTDQEIINLKSLFNRICENEENESNTAIAHPPIPIIVIYHAIYQFFERMRQMDDEKYDAENIALIFFLSFLTAIENHEPFEGYKLSDFISKYRHPLLFQRIKETKLTHCRRLDFKLEVNCNGENNIKNIFDELSEEDKVLFITELTSLDPQQYPFKNDLLNSLTGQTNTSNDVDDCGFSKRSLQFFHRSEPISDASAFTPILRPLSNKV